MYFLQSFPMQLFSRLYLLYLPRPMKAILWHHFKNGDKMSWHPLVNVCVLPVYYSKNSQCVDPTDVLLYAFLADFIDMTTVD